MATDDRAADARGLRVAGTRAHLFAVRLWKEEVADGAEYRGRVRDVISGAFRDFGDWSALTAFMVARIAEEEDAQATQSEGGGDGAADRDE